MDLRLDEKWVELCCSLYVYLANHLTFPCLEFSTNRMGMGAFSCAPETLGDGKHQRVKNHELTERLLLLWVEDSNRMHRKHKLKPHPAALVLLLETGTLPSVNHLVAFVYLTSDGTSGFGMSSWLAPVKLLYHDLPLCTRGAMCVTENKLILRGLKKLLRLSLHSFSAKVSSSYYSTNHTDLTGGHNDPQKNP